MAIHHTRRKKAQSLIGDEKEVPKIIQLLTQAEFTEDEIREILQTPSETDESFVNAAPADTKTQAKQSKMADFDIFFAQAKVKDYRHVSGETKTTITHFELQRKETTVRIEPQLAKDFNRFAIGFTDVPGRMYFPKGEKVSGDTIPYNDPTYQPLKVEEVTNDFM